MPKGFIDFIVALHAAVCRGAVKTNSLEKEVAELRREVAFLAKTVAKTQDAQIDMYKPMALLVPAVARLNKMAKMIVEHSADPTMAEEYNSIVAEQYSSPKVKKEDDAVPAGAIIN